MTKEEKGVWITGVVGIAAYGTYLSMILSLGMPLLEVAYAWPMIWSMIGAIVVSIVLHILVALIWPKEAGKMDARDKQIARFGDHVGNGFLMASALSALLMALAQWDYFWIANVIYLGFVLSQVLATIVKVLAYRGKFQPW